MIKSIYLYNQNISGRVVPVLERGFSGFSDSTMSSKGLEGLADALISSVRINFGPSYNGEIKVNQYPNLKWSKLLEKEGISTFVLSDKEKREFESYFPRELKISWINNAAI